jgi:hypothetical protein
MHGQSQVFSADEVENTRVTFMFRRKPYGLRKWDCLVALISHKTEQVNGDTPLISMSIR